MATLFFGRDEGIAQLRKAELQPIRTTRPVGGENGDRPLGEARNLGGFDGLSARRFAVPFVIHLMSPIAPPPKSSRQH